MGTVQMFALILAMVLASTFSLVQLNADAVRRESTETLEVLADANAIARDLQSFRAVHGTYVGAIVPSRSLLAEFSVSRLDSVAAIEVSSTYLTGLMTVDPRGSAFSPSH